MKIVVNKRFGGFSLSAKQIEIFGVSSPYATMERRDSRLISSVESGDTGGGCATLVVVEIPDESHYIISEYDGYETLYYSASPIEEK